MIAARRGGAGPTSARARSRARSCSWPSTAATSRPLVDARRLSAPTRTSRRTCAAIRRRCSPPPVRRARSGGCRSTRRRAPAAARAWSRARPRTTCRSSARSSVAQGPRDALDPHRSLLRRSADEPIVNAADAVPALRERAVRVRVPGQRDRRTAPTASTRGLQPLRRHAVLLATTARTRSGGSTGSTSSTHDGRALAAATPTSPCARAA